MNHDQAIEGEVRELVRAGRMFEAVKRLHKAGVSLAEAKDTVERIAAESPAALAPATRPDADQDPEVRRLLLEGQWIVAIKRYRELTGVGLKEARDAVKRIAEGFPAELHPTVWPPGVLDDEVRRLVHEGQKIEAIRRYREVTGVDLKEAKEAVERIAAETPGALPSPTAQPAGDLDPEVRRLIVEGQWIAAIQRFRELTGVGHKEAQDAVDRIAAEMPGAAPAKSGCLGVLASLPAAPVVWWVLHHALG